MFFLVILTVIVEAINEIHVESNINNYYIFHLFSVFEFSLISLFYYRFFNRYFKAPIIIVFIFVFFAIAYIDYRINGFNSVDDFSISVEAIILTFYSLFLFYYILKNLLFENLLAAPVFWINAGIIIYFSGNLILFVFSSYLFETEPERYHMVWYSIHSTINILLNILFGIGFWKTKVR